MAKTKEILKDEEEISKIDLTPNQRESAAFRRASFHPPDEIWNIFTEAENCCDIIGYFRVLVKTLNIDSSLHGREFYDTLKSKLTSWKCQSLWDLLNVKLKQAEYEQGKVGKAVKCLIIGAGPIGLRTAIEMLALGCKTVILDKRTEFTRNNVLHLWPFLLTDFRSLGAKKFYGKFGAGSIDHINIKTLQCILLKVALVLGAEIHVGVNFKHLIEPGDETSGWKASFEPENHILSKYVFNVCIGADGKKNVLPGFPQIELRGALAIGITCNFVNHNTIEEARVPEISGVSCQFNPNFFKNMEEQYGVKLENIVYYKNETHYFVMTALKASLLKLGVIVQDFSEPRKLLDPSNINSEKLIEYTLSAVNFATNHQLPDLEFKMLSNGKPDIALFDFTSIKKAANAARIIERKKQKLLLALVGDSLMEPFWPTGSGCGRGVLSALDVAWSVRQFSKNVPPLAILRDRENVFKLLSGITNDQLQKNYNAFTINPLTRYSAFDAKKVSNLATLKKLYETDDIENADMTVSSPQSPGSPKKALRKRRSGGNTSPHKLSTHIHLNKQSKNKRKSDRAVLKDQALVGNTKAFWEDHNKKNLEERAKERLLRQSKSVLTEEESNEEAEDDFEEIKNDVLEELPPVKKKGFVLEKPQPLNSLKRHSPSGKLKTKDESIPKHKVFRAKGGGLNNKSNKTAGNLLPNHLNKKEEVVEKQTSLSGKTPQVLASVTKDKNSTTETVTSKEQPRPVLPKNFFERWIEDFLTKNKTTEGIHCSVTSSIETAAMTVMAVPILLDCSKAPRRQTTELKVKELKKSIENASTVSNDKKELIQISRNTSVKNAVAKYKQIAEKDLLNSDYYDFLKKNRSNSPDQVDAPLLENDFKVKEVIDVEKAMLDNSKEEKKRSRVTKKSSNESILDLESPLRMLSALEELCNSQTPLTSLLLLQVLYNIHKRIQMFPSEDKYYRVYTKGIIFERYVWLLNGAESFLQLLGWVKCGNYIVLSKSTSVLQILKVIEEIFKKKKRAQVAYSGSVQDFQKKPTSVRRAHSNVETAVVEDVVETHVYSEDVDSAIGSDEELGKPRLKRLKSVPHILGEEEYIVVDFVGEDVLSKVKPTQEDTIASTFKDKLSPKENDSLMHNLHFGESAKENVNCSAPTNLLFSDKCTDSLVLVKSVSLDENADNSVLAAIPSVEQDPNSAYSVPVIISRGNFKKAPRKKVFRANKGLKRNIKSELNNPDQVSNDSFQLSDHVSEIEPKLSHNSELDRRNQNDQKLSNEELSNQNNDTINDLRSNSSSVILRKSSIIESEKTSPSINLSKKSSPNPSRKSSPNLSRKSSLQNSLNTDDRSKSIVAQNKFLFDQQIANEFKNKVTIERPERPRSALNLNGFNQPKSQSLNSLKKSINEEVPLAGIVSGARALFEGGKHTSNEDRLSLRSFQEEELKSLGLGKPMKKNLNEDHVISLKDRKENDATKFAEQRELKTELRVEPLKDVETTKKNKFSLSKHKKDSIVESSNNSHKKSSQDSVIEFADAKLDFSEDKIEIDSTNKKKKKSLFSRRNKNKNSTSLELNTDVPFHDLPHKKDVENISKQKTVLIGAEDLNEQNKSGELTNTHLAPSDSDVSVILGNIINRKSVLLEKKKNEKKMRLGFKKKNKQRTNSENQSEKAKSIGENYVDMSKARDTSSDKATVFKESLDSEERKNTGLHNPLTTSVDLSIGASNDFKIRFQKQTSNADNKDGHYVNTLSASNSNYSFDGEVTNNNVTDASSHDDDLVEMLEETSKQMSSSSIDLSNELHNFETSHEKKKKKRFPFSWKGKEKSEKKKQKTDETSKVLPPKSLEFLPRSKTSSKSSPLTDKSIEDEFETDEVSKKKKGLFKKKKKIDTYSGTDDYDLKFTRMLLKQSSDEINNEMIDNNTNTRFADQVLIHKEFIQKDVLVEIVKSSEMEF